MSQSPDKNVGKGAICKTAAEERLDKAMEAMEEVFRKLRRVGIKARRP